jgi:hypothetical protein
MLREQVLNILSRIMRYGVHRNFDRPRFSECLNIASQTQRVHTAPQVIDGEIRPKPLGGS